MARLIKETPLLKGQDAKKFIEENSLPKSVDADKERARILENYQLFQPAENFNGNIKTKHH
jgi:hypothetical protein